MPLHVGELIPSFKGATEWLNQNQDGADTPKNVGLVLVYFWAKSCPPCHANMPDLQALRDRYGPKGLQVVAVHMPRGEFDLDLEKVTQTAKELGITEPCAIDNDHAIGDAFGVTAWPTYFLFGPDNKLRRQAKGNFGVRMMEQALIRLFDDKPAEPE